MLIVSRKNRDQVQRVLARALRAEHLIDRIVLDGSQPTVLTLTWREHFDPCIRFAGTDTRLLHRINRLKAAWRSLLQSSTRQSVIARYCWRYFGLLHHAIRIGLEKQADHEILPILRRIIAFESFTVSTPGSDARAAGVVCHRNPIYLLGRLPQEVCNPTPRHVPVVLPTGTDAPFYHYRQYTLADEAAKILLFPSVDLSLRQESFAAIDRFARLTCNRQDPFADSRAKVLSKRVLAPVAGAILATKQAAPKPDVWRLLDLGSGTGHLIGQICVTLPRVLPALRRAPIEVCCVDASAPSSGRTHGLSGQAHGFASLEWITADYRQLLDDDLWYARQPRFHIATLCRLLDNMSLFSFEPTGVLGPETRLVECQSCLPHRCLSPRLFPHGIAKLEIGTTKRTTAAGKIMPQLSLGEFFNAMKAVWLNDPEHLRTSEWNLPCRQYNPGSLITRSGKSIIAQLLKLASAIVIEDLDLSPERLKQHLQQFGIANAAAVQFVRDGFSTEAYHYVITSLEIASRIRGARLW